MNNSLGMRISTRAGRSSASDVPDAAVEEPLEVNVIFTGRDATAAALRRTQSFARGLRACIRIRAGIVVPVQLSLDQPLVSVDFFEQILRELASQPELDGVDCSAHLYLCRDWSETLAEILKPNSVVVVGVRKRWWPTAETRLVRALRAKGIRVVLVDDIPKSVSSQQPPRKMSAWLLARQIRNALPLVQSPGIREVK
jgi:hypothetical protein